MDPLLLGIGVVVAGSAAVTAWSNRHIARRSKEEVARQRLSRAADEARRVGLEAVSDTLWRAREGDQELEITIVPAAGNPKTTWNQPSVQGRIFPVRAAARTTVRIMGRNDEGLDLKLDVQIGDAELDPRHVITGSDRREVARLVGFPAVRDVLRAQLVPFELVDGRVFRVSRIQRLTLDDNGLGLLWFDPQLPEGTLRDHVLLTVGVLRAFAAAFDAAHSALPPPSVADGKMGGGVSSSGSPFAIRTR